MDNFLDSAVKQFRYYRSLGEKAMAQVGDEALHWQYDPGSNSIATIVKHLHGNMLSRWTDLLTTDGEKPWRKRDQEFEADNGSREQILQMWEKGWACLLDTLESLEANDLQKIVYIRNEGHTVMEAINRQLAHYPYHVGQIVYLARMQAGANWKSLSIPKNGSKEFNDRMFETTKYGNALPKKNPE